MCDPDVTRRTCSGVKEAESTQFLHGEYTSCLLENTIHSRWVEDTQVDCRNTQFLVENTQVDCWRIHSFHYRKSLKEIENTQFLGGEYTS
jgi:hypothetical protein